MKKFIKKVLQKTWAWTKPYLTVKMIPCLLLSWMITNGWAYIFIIVGPIIGANWMTISGTAWMVILWSPLAAEKFFVTLPLAGVFYRLIYKEKFIKKKEDDVNAK